MAALAPAPATAAAKRPAKLSGTSSTLTGKVVTATWRAVPSGTVQIAVRYPSGKRSKTVLRGVPAKKGTGRVTVPGSTPARTKLSVRLRRCTGSGRARQCGAWTGWKAPAAPSSKLPGADTTPTPTPTPAPVGPGGTAPGTTTPLTTAKDDGPTVGGCPQMPYSWALNQRVDQLPLAARSDDYVNFISASKKLHPDFGSADLGAGPDGFGIPFRVVPENTAPVKIEYRAGMYEDESDKGDFPIPLDTPVEGGVNAAEDADRHVSVVQQGTCILHELGNAKPQANSWLVSGSYKFNLVTGAPRPVGWTSGDAAGLPIEPLLARYDEAASGRIKHAIRFTAHGITNAYIPPASHFAPSSSDPSAPPMGQRFRMKASYDTSRLTGTAKVIATAMKEYGLVLADTGSDWYVTGAPDRRWDEDNLSQLKTIPGSAFEAVDSAPVVRR